MQFVWQFQKWDISYSLNNHPIINAEETAPITLLIVAMIQKLERQPKTNKLSGEQSATTFF